MYSCEGHIFLSTLVESVLDLCVVDGPHMIHAGLGSGDVSERTERYSIGVAVGGGGEILAFSCSHHRVLGEHNEGGSIGTHLFDRERERCEVFLGEVTVGGGEVASVHERGSVLDVVDSLDLPTTEVEVGEHVDDLGVVVHVKTFLVWLNTPLYVFHVTTLSAVEGFSSSFVCCRA